MTLPPGCLDRGADAGRSDAESLGELGYGRGPRHGYQPSAQPEQGARGEAGALGDIADREPSGVDEGLERFTLACHGLQRVAGTSEEKQSCRLTK